MGPTQCGNPIKVGLGAERGPLFYLRRAYYTRIGLSHNYIRTCMGGLSGGFGGRMWDAGDAGPNSGALYCPWQLRTLAGKYEHPGVPHVVPLPRPRGTGTSAMWLRKTGHSTSRCQSPPSRMRTGLDDPYYHPSSPDRNFWIQPPEILCGVINSFRRFSKLTCSVRSRVWRQLPNSEPAPNTPLQFVDSFLSRSFADMGRRNAMPHRRPPGATSENLQTSPGRPH